jgi:hypothetical protein
MEMERGMEGKKRKEKKNSVSLEPERDSEKGISEKKE